MQRKGIHWQGQGPGNREGASAGRQRDLADGHRAGASRLRGGRLQVAGVVEKMKKIMKKRKKLDFLRKKGNRS